MGSAVGQPTRASTAPTRGGVGGLRLPCNRCHFRLKQVRRKRDSPTSFAQTALSHHPRLSEQPAAGPAVHSSTYSTAQTSAPSVPEQHFQEEISVVPSHWCQHLGQPCLPMQRWSRLPACSPAYVAASHSSVTTAVPWRWAVLCAPNQCRWAPRHLSKPAASWDR